MQTRLERIDKTRVVLEVEVESGQVEQALDRAYRKLVRQVNIPGFRQGRVPRRILENYMGKASLYNEAMDEIIPQAYMQAIEENKVEPVAQPELELVRMEEGQPLVFKATVDIKPEVTLGEYKELEVERPPVEVTEEQVEEQLHLLQRRYARLTPLEEGEVASGDLVTLDFYGQVNGESFPGSDAQDYTLEIGAGYFLPGFEEQLIGAKLGETREVRISFPQDYPSEQLAGQEVVFQVNIKEIKRPEYALLDDEFAKDVSDFATLEELKADIRQKLQDEAEQSALASVRRQVIEKAAENASLEIPESMIRQRVELTIGSLRQHLQQQSLDWEEYLETNGLTEEDVREKYRDTVIKDIRAELVMEAIAKAENIQASDAEVEEEIGRLAAKYNREPEQIRKELGDQGREMIKDSLLTQKTTDFLMAHANQRDVKNIVPAK